MVSYWSLSDSKSSQVSSILTARNNSVVLMVSTCPLVSNSSSLFTNPLGIVPSAQTTIGITASFMFYSLQFFSFEGFSQQCEVSVWRLSDSKSSQVTTIPFSIMAIYQIALV